jgi:hypothetical protein
VTDTLSDRVAAEIRAQLSRQRINQVGLATLIGKPYSWVQRRISSGETALGLNDVEQIAAVLGTTPLELIERATTERTAA